MKAHTAEKQEIILSIGMIVKNEEKVLERCLKSLQPLMKAIPSELIIADTGSTDSTVEIAQKYTDNVFYFEWINDFAAARNSTLEKANGKWYFFLDADEYLDEGVSEIINFFNDKNSYLKYNTAEIIVRNYDDKELKTYRDASLDRFQRINNYENKIRFTGKIHEAIFRRYPLYSFSTALIHHTGYSYESANQNYKKEKRNYNLMKEIYKDNPKDIRILCHLIDGTRFEPAECEKYIDCALKLIRNDRKNYYANAIYTQAISYYISVDPEYSIKLSNEYCSSLEDSEKYVATVSVYLLKAYALFKTNKFEESYNYFLKYFELYRMYKQNKLDNTDLSAHIMDGLTASEFLKYKCLAVQSLIKLKRYDESIVHIDEFIYDKELEGKSFCILLDTIRELCKASKKYDLLVKYFNVVISFEDENKSLLALYMMENIYYSNISVDVRMFFVSQLIKFGVKGRYSELMNLIVNQQKDNFIAELSDFINRTDNWKEGYSEAIYLAVKYGIDISEAVDKMDASSFREKLETIAVHHDDFAKFVLNYGVPEGYTQNIKRFYWITSLYEKSAYRSFEMNDKARYSLYLKFVELLGEYVSNIYNPELLQDENDVQVLPPLHKFGYYMLEANTALLNEDSVGYVRGMKKALQNCESMKEIIEFMLEQFKKKIGMN